MTTDIIPPFTPPSEVRARLRNSKEAATRELADACAAALAITSSDITVVCVKNGTPGESVNAVMSALADAGYHVTRRGACNDTGMLEIVISLEVL
jgi:hypothetical protein